MANAHQNGRNYDYSICRSHTPNIWIIFFLLKQFVYSFSSLFFFSLYCLHYCCSVSVFIFFMKPFFFFAQLSNGRRMRDCVCVRMRLSGGMRCVHLCMCVCVRVCTFDGFSSWIGTTAATTTVNDCSSMQMCASVRM